ncbi:MAG: hypothetical protein HY751_01845 [Nitrospinae bacterium]|nr:hypothetical protein [Nitrospinota bacterium]
MPEPYSNTRESGSVVVMMSESMCTRVFMESGILAELAARSPMPVIGLLAHESSKREEYARRFPNVKFFTLADVFEGVELGLARKAHMYIDQRLEPYIGFYPLAMRLAMTHGFNEGKRQKGHKNLFHNPDTAGPLPHWKAVYDLMRAWYFSGLRFIHPGIARFFEKHNAHCLVVNNSQTPTVHPFAYTAKRMGLRTVNYVASWDHLVGKGALPAYYDAYIVQNGIMVDSLERYHGVSREKARITGWPLMDKYSLSRPVADYAAKMKSWGLDPSKPCVLMAGNTEINAPYEPNLFERILKWRNANGGPDKWQAVARPHPKDIRWKERFSALLNMPGVHVQSDTLGDMDELAMLLRHVSAVVCTGGSVLLDSLVNDRPLVGVTYDEGAPAGVNNSIGNYTMFHYREIMESGAFYRADDFDEVAHGISRALDNFNELSPNRRALAKTLVGELDGMAVTRVVDNILETSMAPSPALTR